MNSTDLVQMLGNLSRSLFPVQQLLSGFAYVMGILCFFVALAKLKKIGETAGRGSQEKLMVPFAYIIGGTILVFLPSGVSSLANTTFGAGNILAYTDYNPYNIYSSMGLIIQTAGLIWFIRGCVLLVGASHPNVKHGSKGLAFLFAGILAMNFQSTAAFLNTVMNGLESLTMTIASNF
ncbi:hypothetical protein [Legionella micdadei]|uniref:DotV membrane protein of dot/Icm type IV secretion system n=1 Tax=Legionella micdadei TaxID=451 RepID=A0A098GDR9_LEGMI|nr:hypothetical protein [Legionella micdadei]ARG98204.1 type IV secretion protein IcmC [Legionella micdadei]ARH00999.1 type IV secretion protein IcmC [Legionella micdadei]KTD29981.1 protein IcmC (DotV)-like protein [Legionella micdadei]NSL18961.1 type IV secretion protein IcmC [Legionella micdadei]CEG60137.1 dotV membrane protein of dot/Icm type IV secretion system [Legionella micdadei]